MIPKKSLGHGAVILCIAFFITSAGSNLFKNKQMAFECKSDIVTRKTYLSGDVIALSLSALVVYDGHSSIHAFYKGSMKKENKILMVDRTFKLKIKKMPDSNIFHIIDKKIERSREDTAQPGIVNQLQMDNIDYFYVTRVKHNAILIQGMMLPIMMCTNI